MIDIIGVPVSQFGGGRQPQRRAILSKDRSQAITDIFKLLYYVPHQNTYVPDDIRVLTNPLMEKNPKETVELLSCEYIRVGKNGA